VIDYLQLLDQKRLHAPLAEQVAALEAFARERGTLIVFVSQIARSYDPAKSPTPSLSDVRLPNAIDLALFTKTCFLNNGEIHIQAAH
jgi:replicative DNA helicase